MFDLKNVITFMVPAHGIETFEVATQRAVQSQG